MNTSGEQYAGPDSLSRRERRELHRAQMKQGQEAVGRKRIIRRAMLWGMGALVLGAVVWGMARLASDVQLPGDGSTLVVPVSASDNILGPASASATLVEYSDFQCPACRAFQPVVKQLLAEPELAGKVRLVYRHFPLSGIHQNAELAAWTAQAAGLQGAFWTMHDKLFEQQGAWAGLSSAGARAAFIGFARELGLDVDRFVADLDSDAIHARVQADVDGGFQAGVNSTPTFFLNGTKLGQFGSYEEFKQAVTTAANANP